MYSRTRIHHRSHDTKYTIHNLWHLCCVELVISFHAVAVLGAQSYYLFFYYAPVCVCALAFNRLGDEYISAAPPQWKVLAFMKK